MVPPCSDRITRVPPYSSSLLVLTFHIRGYHPLWPDFPDRSVRFVRLMVTGLFRVRSPLLAESRLISFPPGTEMFQFPGFASPRLCIQHGIRPKPWVSPFGHIRIRARLPAPRSFRRLLRPSSPPTAKASTTYAYSLDHITPIILE